MNTGMKLLMQARYVLALLLICSLPARTQSTASPDKEASYTKVLTDRAGKIVNTLDLADSAKSTRVQKIIIQQYRDLNNIHEQRNTQVNNIKKQVDLDKANADARIKKYEDEANASLEKLHVKYLANLSAELTPAQVDQVKDGMTYGVLPITYKGYLAMLPELTEQQKIKIMANLTEAREHAMDAESSEKKHAWFGKYKGRINNYLSAEGYNMKKAGEEWEKRIKAEEAEKLKK